MISFSILDHRFREILLQKVCYLQVFPLCHSMSHDRPKPQGSCLEMPGKGSNPHTRGWQTLQCDGLNCDAVVLYWTAMDFTGLDWTAIEYFALHCTALHYIALYCTALHCTTLHCSALHFTALHCTALKWNLTVTSGPSFLILLPFNHS